jgi:hypothetical protein
LSKPENDRDYGSEVIEILLQVMEKPRNDIVVIFAGYKEKMVKFYGSNPGLAVLKKWGPGVKWFVRMKLNASKPPAS